MNKHIGISELKTYLGTAINITGASPQKCDTWLILQPNGEVEDVVEIAHNDLTYELALAVAGYPGVTIVSPVLQLEEVYFQRFIKGLWRAVK